MYTQGCWFYDGFCGLIVYDRSHWHLNCRTCRKNGIVIIEKTDYWKAMEKNRVGNLLAGARLKAGLTQAQLAGKLGIRQNMISDYERGRRTYSDDMARRLSNTLNVKEEHLRYGSEQSAAS